MKGVGEKSCGKLCGTSGWQDKVEKCIEKFGGKVVVKNCMEQ